MDAWRPRNLIFHDYGGTPQNADGVFNPYHALVFPDGKIRYRDPANPYAAPAPHAYKLNPASIGLSYAGPVGSTPTPEALNALKQEYQRIKSLFPDIEALSHGEAYQRTKGTPQQASRLGRGLDEASWRTILLGTGAAPAGLTPPQPQQAPPPPVSARPAQGATMTPQSPQLPAYTGATPNDVETQRKMAQALMMQGMSTEPVGHWTQALARVLQGASGGMHQAQARKGEQQGTAELARMLGGGGTPDAGALIQNPWTRDIGTKIAVAKMTQKPETTTGQRDYELAKKQGFSGTFLDYQTALANAKRPTTNVTVNGDKEGAKVLAKRQGERVEAGDQSRKMKADIEVLSDLSTKIGTVGATGAVVQALGPYANALGIKIDGLPDIEAFSSVISRVAPTMRPPGSGATSDFEFKQFLNALPKLSQTIEGRQRVIEQLGALADYNIAVGQIAEASLAGEIDRQEARRRTEALGNPMQLWRKNNPTADGNRSGAGRFSPQAPIAAPPSAAPPAEAIEMLRQNPTPQTRAQFDEIFGAGASSRVLGGR